MEEKTEKSCNTCGKGMSKSQTALLMLSLFIFATSVYGIITLIKDIYNYFN